MKEFLNMDCMIGMKEFPDKFFDLAIVDPPYFSGPEKRAYYGMKISTHGVKRVNYKPLNYSWKMPSNEYFDQLFRISKQQIVWGCNYYKYDFGPGRIIWDKCNQSSSYSDVEIAYCSLHFSLRLFRYLWNGMMQGTGGNGATMQGNKKLNEVRIHPTQKPVQLYKWLLRNYAKPEFKILDTHVGSASSIIAFEDFGCEYMGYEIDKEYYRLASKRIAGHLAEPMLI